VEESGYRVRGTATHAPPPVNTPRPAWSIRGLFKAKADPCPEPDASDGAWECEYSVAEIERLDGWYTALRKRSGMPDDYAPSQVLRVVGAYAEDRKWALQVVRRTKGVIEIQHLDAGGGVHVSSQKYADLYDFCFHMSRARKPLSEAV
jgi:hypothetical protein